MLRLIASVCLALSLSAPAAASPLGRDDPVVAKRMDDVRSPTDACGGEGLLDAAVPDGPFLEACRHHDACYHSGALTQSDCDNDFLIDMRAACEARYPVEKSKLQHGACQAAAYSYFRSVNSRFGSLAYGGGKIGGEITSHEQIFLKEADGSNELRLCATIRNPEARILAYNLVLHDAKGKWVDTEPDIGRVKLAPGETRNVCVDTDGALHRSWKTLGDAYAVTLKVDDPDTLSPINDLIGVDRLDCDKASGVCVHVAP